MEKWWNESVIYQVYPRSFQDSNGDGEGDLKGITSRLYYIKELGVDAIWLSPFYTSPNNDGGYDVADPRDVDPRFGNLEDAKELFDKAHQQGLRVIVDIVPNHFSSEHRWFKEALNAPKDSPARKRFHFYDGKDSNTPPNNWISLFGGPAWTQVSDGQWYLHNFAVEQPDLNWDHPEVREDFLTTLRFWSDRGVDGFRIDAAKHMPASAWGSIMANVRQAYPQTKLGEPIWFTQEVIPDGGVNMGDYTPLGTVNEFRFTYLMRDAFRGQNGQTLSSIPAAMGSWGNWGGSWGFLQPQSATVFVNNWDTERDGSSMTAASGVST